jgi:hypothetical protein
VGDMQDLQLANKRTGALYEQEKKKREIIRQKLQVPPTELNLKKSRVVYILNDDFEKILDFLSKCSYYPIKTYTTCIDSTRLIKVKFQNPIAEATITSLLRTYNLKGKPRDMYIDEYLAQNPLANSNTLAISIQDSKLAQDRVNSMEIEEDENNKLKVEQLQDQIERLSEENKALKVSINTKNEEFDVCMHEWHQTLINIRAEFRLKQGKILVLRDVIRNMKRQLVFAQIEITEDREELCSADDLISKKPILNKSDNRFYLEFLKKSLKSKKIRCSSFLNQLQDIHQYIIFNSIYILNSDDIETYEKSLGLR